MIQSTAAKPTKNEQHEQYRRIENLIHGFGRARAMDDPISASQYMGEIHMELSALIYKETK